LGKYDYSRRQKETETGTKHGKGDKGEVNGEMGEEEREGRG
jgi:hypothetical protein